MTQNPRFVFAVCQRGAESACKHEILANHPEMKLSFSRPGFITFKCDDQALPEKFALKSCFARTYGWSIEHATITDTQSQIKQLGENDCLRQADHLHVFERDTSVPGVRGFEPGPTVLANDIGARIAGQLQLAGINKPVNRVAGAEDLVFDLIMVEPDQWYFGYHFAQSRFQRWPGGAPCVDTTRAVLSRAYFKLLEALLWSGIRINPGDCCAEIGASPGGGCQLLLEKGARVIAIDPAELADDIAQHPNLTYIRARGREVRKVHFKPVRWLISDINAAPKYTLDTIEDIVTNQHGQHIRGLILTIKLTDWKLAREIQTWKQRVRGFGFQVVKTRQLAFNRKEICLVAIRDQYALRSSRKPRKS